MAYRVTGLERECLEMFCSNSAMQWWEGPGVAAEMGRGCHSGTPWYPWVPWVVSFRVAYSFQNMHIPVVYSSHNVNIHISFFASSTSWPTNLVP